MSQWETTESVAVERTSTERFEIKCQTMKSFTPEWYAALDQKVGAEGKDLADTFGKRFVDAIEDNLSIRDLESIISAASERLEQRLAERQERIAS